MVIPSWTDEEIDMFREEENKRKFIFIDENGEEDDECLRDIMNSDLKLYWLVESLTKSLYKDMDNGLTVNDVFNKYLTNGA